VAQVPLGEDAQVHPVVEGRFDVTDPAAARKSRGAFFTPAALCRYVVDWAVRDEADTVFEPSCGEAAFLTAAGERLAALAAAGRRTPAQTRPPEGGRLRGVELHEQSARRARAVLRTRGWSASIAEGDFFTHPAEPVHDAVVGNPPYVRYQQFSGEARARAREVALAAGVPLSGLASSWAAFTVHAAGFLRHGGRLGLVLPAELLTVNYASPVRRFLLQRFRSVRLVLFTERIFPGVLEEVVLLLADGYGEGPTDHCELIEADNVEALGADSGIVADRSWRPIPPEGKWTASLVGVEAAAVIAAITERGGYTPLEAWGDTTLGMVTGNNAYFALAPVVADGLRLGDSERLPISPPGSRHLRGLDLDRASWERLGATGRRTELFRPPALPSAAARRYIADGERDGVDRAYKCRVRTPWWRVPVSAPADLLLTYMNADTPRIVGNSAGVHHLNSVHGVYLRDGVRRAGSDLLPLGSLNSMTILGAELVGRAYGGGMLKLEPREADLLPVPAPELLDQVGPRLEALRPRVAEALAHSPAAAALLVDEVLLRDGLGVSESGVEVLRAAARRLHERRLARGGAPKEHGHKPKEPRG
jgi:adenine-specific DNA-methyltransferase